MHASNRHVRFWHIIVPYLNASNLQLLLSSLKYLFSQDLSGASRFCMESHHALVCREHAHGEFAPPFILFGQAGERFLAIVGNACRPALLTRQPHLGKPGVTGTCARPAADAMARDLSGLSAHFREELFICLRTL